jgi:hypothetical protein
MDKKYYALPKNYRVGENDEIPAEKLQKYLKENFDKVKPTLLEVLPDEAVIEKLNSNEQLLQQVTDRRVTQAIKTFEENFKKEKLPAIIEKELKKRNPELTPEQIKIKELEEKIKQTELEAKRNKLISLALKKLSEEKVLPEGNDLLVELMFQAPTYDENELETRLKILTTVIRTTAEKIAQEKFKQFGRGEPPEKGGELNSEEEFKKEYEELIKAGKTQEAVALVNKWYSEKNQKNT